MQETCPKLQIVATILKLPPYIGNYNNIIIIPESHRMPITGVIYYKCPKL
jgi:hypothetical protein